MAFRTNQKNQYAWSRENTKILIEIYETYPCLYITSLPEYHDKNVKNRALKAITETFNQRTGTTLKLEDIQKKIHGIRTQYLGELNKIKKSKASGCSTDEVYTPKLWSFEFLNFLRPSGELVSKGESNLNIPESSQLDESGNVEQFEESEIFEIFVEDDVYEETEPNETIQTSPVPPELSQDPTPKRKRQKQTDKIENLLDVATMHLSRVANKENVTPSGEHNLLFGKMIAGEIDTIKDDAILDELKEEIMGLVYQAKRRFRQSNQ